MTVRHLDKLFRPASVAVIGASDRPQSVGAVVIRNLLSDGFDGPVWPVNPKHRQIAGVQAYRDVASLPDAPDLGVICTPPATVPGLIADLGKRGGRAAVVLTAGLSRETTSDGRTLQQAMLDAARPYTFRILGPNCVGLLSPGIGLNASFSHAAATPGPIAFVSQSGALCTAVLDWARSQSVGFSHFVSLGDSADVDFGDVIDYLGADGVTRAILLYIESVKHARKFLSAARAAARNKPILAIRAGRVKEGASAAASHTGALAGNDAAYDAAFRRAGIVRVYSTDELFDAAETLAKMRPLRGERLAIATNGGGPGVLATDALIKGGGKLADISPDTLAALDAVLPANWSRANPIDIIGDAPGERYAAAVRALLADKQNDALLVMHAPTAIASAEAAATATIEAAADTRKNVLTCWLGRDGVATARQRFAEAGMPTYDTPRAAVRAFLHMTAYRHRQDALMQIPASLPTRFTPATDAARAVIAAALERGEGMLSEPDAKQVLAAYGVPVVATAVARDADEAVSRADGLGYPVALKILSPDISHKSDVGGVALDLGDAAALRTAADGMLARVEALKPGARIDGFTVQTMARRPGAHELIVGAATDPIFGPVVLFGEGGKAVEVIGDRALALPPLNMSLAADLIAQTRISRLLAGYRDEPAIDMPALQLTLVQIAQLICDLPEIVELDINPLFADARGVLALDARIGIAAADGGDRLAIKPYPKELEETFRLADGREVLLRPIRPEDEPTHAAFLNGLDEQDIRMRFFGLIRSFAHTQVARLTQIDYDREMAFIATAPAADGGAETLGVVRSVTDPDNRQTEFAIIVRSDQKRQGLGRKLMTKMIAYCRARGTMEMIGQIKRENAGMRALAKDLGFNADGAVMDDVVEVRIPLNNPAAAG